MKKTMKYFLTVVAVAPNLFLRTQDVVVGSSR
jgi:hypothetical protein